MSLKKENFLHLNHTSIKNHEKDIAEKKLLTIEKVTTSDEVHKLTGNITTSEKVVKGTDEVHKSTDNIKTNEEVDKGTEKLEDMK